MTFARRVDGTHKEVMTMLRRCGWKVLDTSRLRGFVDLVAMRHGEIRLIEVKASTGKLTGPQRELMDSGWPIWVLRSAEDAVHLE